MIAVICISDGWLNCQSVSCAEFLLDHRRWLDVSEIIWDMKPSTPLPLLTILSQLRVVWKYRLSQLLLYTSRTHHRIHVILHSLKMVDMVMFTNNSLTLTFVIIANWKTFFCEWDLTNYHLPPSFKISKSLHMDPYGVIWRSLCHFLPILAACNIFGGTLYLHVLVKQRQWWT